MSFLQGLANFLGGAASGDPAFGYKMKQARQAEAQRTALSQLFSDYNQNIPQMARPGDAIGQLINTVAPETKPSALQQYQSLLMRSAMVDPERYGGAALGALDPGQELDYQLKQMQIANGPINQQILQAQLDNARSEARSKAERKSYLSQLFGNAMPQQTPNFNPAIPMGGNVSARPSAADIAPIADAMLPAVQNMAIPQADNINSRGASLGAPPTPDQMGAQVQQLVGAMQPTQQAIPVANVLPPNVWAQTPQGQAALAAGGEEEAIKQYQEYVGKAQESAMKVQQTQAETAVKSQADAVKTFNTAQPKLDAIIKTADSILKNKQGVKNITGGYLSGTATGRALTGLPIIGNKESLYAQADIDALKQQVSIEALTALRQSGVAPGSMTEKEWPRFENALANLNEAQKPEDFLSAVTTVKNIADDIKKRQAAEAGIALPDAQKAATPETPATPMQPIIVPTSIGSVTFTKVSD